jgi:hypothetical protein
MRRRRLLLSLLLLSTGLCLRPATIKWAQQCSAWFSLNDDSPSTPRLGLRWQPSLFLDTALGGPWKLDSELSLDAAGSLAAPGWSDAEVDGELRPYRLWLRLSSSRFEARLGLQKINFGSATVFRPLMWFDRIDPRDPLQITRGVYGLLLRYYFPGNANIWLWGLYGNPDTKGWETRATADETPEFGGRFQVPVFRGEAAATLHFRRLAPAGTESVRPEESRFALDGKWDLGVGLWVEACAVHQNDPAQEVSAAARSDSLPGGGAAAPWQRSVTLGVDYTFRLGNGLYLLAEQFLSQTAASPLGRSDGSAAFTALVARYPVGLLDSLSTIVYYDWRNRQAYWFSSWQRTTDHWQFYLMAFANPRQALATAAPSGDSMLSGAGFQLLAVWNI